MAVIAQWNQWTPTGTVNTTNVLLLPSTARVRFVPNDGFTSTATIQYRAWDQSAGRPGDRLDPTGLNSFSVDIETVTISVTI